MIKKLLQSVMAVVLLSGVAAGSASAVSYGGTTISSTNGTYVVAASAGETVTLANVAGVGTLALTFKNNVAGSVVVTESGTTRPAGAATNASGTVNKYFDISLQGITNADISSSKLTFTVEKAWLNNNGVTAANVVLQHYGSAWENLTTREVSSSSTASTFESTVTSFSPFAITAVAGLSTTGSPYVLGALIAVGVIAIVAGTFIASRKRASTTA